MSLIFFSLSLCFSSGSFDAATRAEYVEARLGKLAESVAARVEQLHDEEDELAARRDPAEHKDLRHARVP